MSRVKPPPSHAGLHGRRHRIRPAGQSVPTMSRRRFGVSASSSALCRAKDSHANCNQPISEVATAVGFDDQGQLARPFRREVSVTPLQYRWERWT